MADKVPTGVMRASRPRAFDAPANTDTENGLSETVVDIFQPVFNHSSNADNSSNLSSTYCKFHVYTLTFQWRILLTRFSDDTDLKSLAPPPQACQLPGPTRTTS